MDSFNRPVIKLKKSPLQIILNSLGIIAFSGTIFYTLLSWGDLPPRIPTHFNAAGEVDGMGSKGSIWALPVIGLILWIGLTILENYPHVYNYINLTKETAERQYKNAVLMVNILKNLIIVLFSYLTWVGIQIGKGHQEGLGIWFLPVFLVLILGTVIFFIVRSVRIS
ncbi:DUF1648 domain-containing protein [Falsibacillus pallidus]|uniref:Uncharacterized protein DUF1648 n=1 Tax=Falsibacillus pallidus TaxID=493781 RepID=A0A370GWE7_9BACI|nr:DUF1648 domain-containing protein [Falsibacillus pallidus]RDI47988.1 uncharacterized protein DUF1648 [Falsibacillus pallidus]